jgi:F420-non-reducing hydrogenase iron-sulfur subunit
MLNTQFQPRILGFLCNWCCYTAADSAGVGRYQYPPNLRVIRLMCTGRLDPSFPLDALANGADGVFVGGCHLGECHYQDGNYHALITAGFVREALVEAGVRGERFLIDWASAAEGPHFVRLITDFTRQVAGLGPLGAAEGEDAGVLRGRLIKAEEAARSLKVRTGLLNASKLIVMAGDYAPEIVSRLIRAKCHRGLSATMAAGGGS